MHVENEIWILLRLKNRGCTTAITYIYYTFVSWQQNCEIIVQYHRKLIISPTELDNPGVFLLYIIGEGLEASNSVIICFLSVLFSLFTDYMRLFRKHVHTVFGILKLDIPPFDVVYTVPHLTIYI